ncbi:hypothetical protein JB92DRAFT_2985471 [Gautieria morchelliformis]|nr:hypothetical protein JB92DRAFT_2985471 [Gautieria morchelliformis]
MAETLHEVGDDSPLVDTLHSSLPNIPDAASGSPPNTPLAQATDAPPERVFWISPPLIDSEEKARYKSILLDTSSTASQDDENETPVEIVGETRQGTDHYYWVVHESDVIHRHPVKQFRGSYPELVDTYDERKDAGTLDTFDENSSRIHPKDRVNKMSISGKSNRARRPVTRSALSQPARRTLVIDSSDEEDDDSQGGYDSQGYEAVDEDDASNKRRKFAEPTRRSTRTTGVTNKISYRDESLSPMKTRANPKRHVSRITQDDGYTDEDDDEDSDQVVSEQVNPKPKKAPRGRLSRPAYGNIRTVADLSDDDSDDEMAALHAHRKTCEKCQDPPAHELLTKFYARGKKVKSQRKVKEDDFEDNVNEEQRYLRLGGWVRCLKCCVAAHWGCLARSQHDEIIKAAREKDKEAEAAGLKPMKRETLEAYDTTEFICGACMKDGICMYCHQVAVTAEPPPQKKPGDEQKEQEQKKLSTQGTPHVSAKEVPVTDMQSRTTPPTIVVDLEQGSAGSSSSSPFIDPTPHESRSNSILHSGDALELLFRCKTCKRLAHYAHLPQPEPGPNLTPAELAQYYQTENDWECSDCISYVHTLDKILAWRPYPADAVEPNVQSGYIPNPKMRLPREYLVKWIGKGYRRLQWVPHMWLAASYSTKLKNFLASGPKIQLLDKPEEVNGGQAQGSLTTTKPEKESDPSFLIAMDISRDPSAQPASEEEEGPPPALPDAERRIPLAWCTIDRLLDIRLWDPAAPGRTHREKKVKTRQSRRAARRKRLESDDEDDTEMDDEDDPRAEAELAAARELGEEPSQEYLETVDHWEQRTGDSFGIEHTELVVWGFIKWADLAYEEATWDSTPVPSDPGYNPFQRALRRFVESRTVLVARKSRSEAIRFDNRKKGLFEQKNISLKSDPNLGQEGKLMEFQLTGVNWLFRNWWRHQPSILADEMGLGKTVQIACLVGHLVESYEVYPVLIVVPNSTITNWLREFDLWAPRLRVVPYYGEANSRAIIRDYELYHKLVPKNFTNLKFHVLVTTYETLIGKDFTSVFKTVPRWELLVIDEGQRLKSDSSLLFRRLNELNTIHRILMTGTPLNNNIRELFNLMNFLDSDNWNNLNALEKKYENLSEELLQELHEALKPYFLRRTKADNEVIVPVSMTAIQKEVYKSILSQNVDILGSLAQPSSRVNAVVKKSNLNNLLMQLRKCLQHPYLVSPELEPGGPDITPQTAHKNLLDASAKLRLLHVLLPKLKARGHRVLLFSQFVIALNIIEDFLVGERHKFLRLDGNTKQAQRQKDMDTYNRPDSDVFIYLLSTRAGGVGINLWSADTVIIFDPDFNPHQDLQAISRAHRFGQTKTVLVFKLMVKGAAEERIVQTGKKKLALDHLIVQKMDDDGVADDVQSILTFGAKAVFEGTETNDINYSEGDIDNLIARTEKEGDDVPEATNSSFGFAKLWVVEKDSMEEVVEDVPADAQDDGFWGNVLARAAAEKGKAKAAEVTGRGAKRRAAVAQGKKKRKSSGESDIEYNASEVSIGRSAQSTTGTPFLSDISSDSELSKDRPKRTSDPFLTPMPAQSAPEIPHTTPTPALIAIENQRYTPDESDDERPCGLCKRNHGTGSCYMTQNPFNLAQYRLMLLSESKELVEARRQAVQAIDSHLAARGLSHLIRGQPLAFFEPGSSKGLPRKAHKSKQTGPTKRPASPGGSSAPNKKAKRADPKASSCVICGGPVHLAKVCPVVKAGPESIRQAITRLSVDPQCANTVNILGSFLPATANEDRSAAS